MNCLFLSAVSLLLIVGNMHGQVLDAAKIRNRHRIVYTSPDRLREYPTPVLIYLRDRPEHEDLKKELLDRVVYPVLNESAIPVAAIVVDFCPEIVVVGEENRYGCEISNRLVVRVTIKRQGGSGFSAIIERNINGHIDRNAYLIFFPESPSQR